MEDNIEQKNEQTKVITRRGLYKDKTAEEVFNHVYDINDWSSDESKSGMGSTLKFTENTRSQLPIICKKYGIKRILDAACGDFNWMKEIVDKFDYYKGTDIVERLIKENTEKFSIEGKVEFEVNDIVNDFKVNGEFDAIIAKDVLVHLPGKYVLKVLKSFKDSGVKYLFLTHFNEIEENADIESFGLWRPLNFQLEPFNFPKPLEIIKEPEPYRFSGQEMMDKTLSFWKIDDLINDLH